MSKLLKLFGMAALTLGLTLPTSNRDYMQKIEQKSTSQKPREKREFFEVFVHERYFQGKFDITIPLQRKVYEVNEGYKEKKEKGFEYITLNAIEKSGNTNSTYHSKVFLKRLLDANPFSLLTLSQDRNSNVVDHRFLVPYNPNIIRFDAYMGKERTSVEVKNLKN